MDALLRHVQQTLQDLQMVNSGQTVLVAVSGGADSVAMLHALYQLRERLAIHLIMAHLNHGMRPSAAADARFVEAMGRDLQLPCICETIDVPAYQRRHKLSPEDAARRVRYAFLGATAERQGAERIAVGHTADDQAETVLLRLLRGAGLRGLCGIPARHGLIIRPLIRVHRQAVMGFLQAHRIRFRDDPSNQARQYTRNRLRLDLIPQLQQGYNPQLVDVLCTTAQLLAADEAALQAVAHERLRAACVQNMPGQVHLRIGGLKGLPIALQRRVLREALREAIGTLRGLTSAHIAAIHRLMQTEAGSKALALPRGAVAERRYGLLLIQRQAPAVGVAVDEPLPIPGQCTIDALGLTLVGRLLGPPSLATPPPTGDAAWLDADKVGRDLRVRTRRPGDRLQPLGSAHAKKLKAVLIDAKIPRAGRDRLPLVVSTAGIAWVVGVRIAEWAKVSPSTRHVLSLQVIRHAPERTLSFGV
jgi:tRNA(Ile)-lysidine synthase